MDVWGAQLLSARPLGDGVHVAMIIDTFLINERIRTMCGIEEGTVELDLSKRSMDPSHVRLLAVELESTRATAGLEQVDISGNPISGARYESYTWKGEDSDLAGVEHLCAALPSTAVRSLKMSDCHLGPKSIAIVASALATAGVEAVDLSNNRFDPSLLDSIKHKVKLNLTGCA